MDKMLGLIVKALPILQFYPQWFQWLFAACLASILVATFFAIILYPIAERNQKGYVEDGGLPQLSIEARKHHRPYVIESATMIVNLDGALPTGTGVGVADVRITYTLFAIDHVTVFDEWFHSSQQNAAIERIEGPNPESEYLEPAIANKAWNVLVDIPRGGRETVVTGARYTYNLPQPHPRRVHDYDDLKPNQDAWCYPNKDDVIGELILIIQTPRRLKAPVLGDKLRVDHTDANQPDEKKAIPDQRVSASGLTVTTAKWRNLQPNQNVLIRLTYE
jgi:hypothetical protein